MRQGLIKLGLKLISSMKCLFALGLFTAIRAQFEPSLDWAEHKPKRAACKPLIKPEIIQAWTKLNSGLISSLINPN